MSERDIGQEILAGIREIKDLKKSKAVEKTNDEEIVVEDLLPKRVSDFVPMKREKIYAG